MSEGRCDLLLGQSEQSRGVSDRMTQKPLELVPPLSRRVVVELNQELCRQCPKRPLLKVRSQGEARSVVGEGHRSV